LPGAARATGVGIFVIAGLLLFAIGLFMIGDRRMAFATKFTLYTQFARITGLQPGAIVRVAGAKAGSVIQILPPGRPSEKFQVQLERFSESPPAAITRPWRRQARRSAARSHSPWPI